MREERRVITVLSADLVGSTALGARLDPEEVKLIVGDVMARVVRVIEGLGGTVKDLAGDGVLALFGAPQAHEDDAERAVRAGCGSWSRWEPTGATSPRRGMWRRSPSAWGSTPVRSYSVL